MIEQIIEDVYTEMARQDSIWGEQAGKPILVWNAILGEEAGEVQKAALENEYRFDLQKIDDELIQVAAVAIKFSRAIRLRMSADKFETGTFRIPPELSE